VKRPLRRSTRRWEDNINTDLKDREWQFGQDLTGLGSKIKKNSCELSNKPVGSIKDEEFLDHLHDFQLPTKNSVLFR
jgi:hypothetical protein